MDAKTQKLAVKLRDPDLAAALVAAGLDTPAKIRAASDEELARVKGGLSPRTRGGLDALEKITGKRG
jgi:hypothetical protein